MRSRAVIFIALAAILGILLTGCVGPRLTPTSSPAPKVIVPTNTPPPTKTTTPTNTPPPTMSATPTSTRTPTNTPRPTMTATPTSTRIPANTPTPTPKPPDAIVAVSELNLREGPSTAYRVIDVMKSGEALAILARSPDGNWIQVTTSKQKKGWCSIQNGYVRVNVELAKIAVATGIPTPPAPTPTPGNAIYVLYFYFGVNCENSRAMAPKVEQFYQTYGKLTDASNRYSRGLAALVPPPIQIPRRWEVKGVMVPGWGSDVSGFRRSTGSTFPVGPDPGLAVNTSRIPVTVVYNKQTGVHRVATVGNVSYATLESSVSAAVQGRTTGGPTSGTV